MTVNKERVADLKRQMREAKGPGILEQIKGVLAGEGAFKVKTLAFLAGVALAVAWLAYLAVTEHLDVVSLLVTHFIPFAVLLAAVAALAMTVTYAVVYLRNSDCFDRHNATSEAKTIRDRIGTADERPGDAAAVSNMYDANTRFIGGLISATIMAFVIFVAISAFARLI